MNQIHFFIHLKNGTYSFISISGFTLDSTTGYCYYVLSSITYLDDADTQCSNLDAELLVFDSDTQVTAFLAVLNTGIRLT